MMRLVDVLATSIDLFERSARRKTPAIGSTNSMSKDASGWFAVPDGEAVAGRLMILVTENTSSAAGAGTASNHGASATPRQIVHFILFTVITTSPYATI